MAAVRDGTGDWWRSVSGDLRYQVTLLDDGALGDGDLGDRTVHLRDHRDLHLHRLQDHQRVAVLDGVTLGHQHLVDVGHHLRAYLFGHRRSSPSDSSGPRTLPEILAGPAI